MVIEVALPMYGAESIDERVRDAAQSIPHISLNETLADIEMKSVNRIDEAAYDPKGDDVVSTATVASSSTGRYL